MDLEALLQQFRTTSGISETKKRAREPQETSRPPPPLEIPPSLEIPPPLKPSEILVLSGDTNIQDAAQEKSDLWCDKYAPSSWSELVAHIEKTSYTKRTARRCDKPLLDECTAWKSGKREKYPLMLIGLPGTGKTHMLRLLAKHLNMEFVAIHADSDAELEEILKSSNEMGLLRRERLWVLEHYDILTKTSRTLILKHWKKLQSSGVVFATSWPLEENLSDLKVRALQLDEWDLASKVMFMTTFSPLDENNCLKALRFAGGNICAAFSGAQTALYTDEMVFPPANLRVIIEDSLCANSTPNTLQMIRESDEDVCLSLLQESIVEAACFNKGCPKPHSQIRPCTSNIQNLATCMDALSACDILSRNAPKAAESMISGVIQDVLFKQGKRPNFSTGITFSAPKIMWHANRPRPIDHTKKIRECRGIPAPAKNETEIDITTFQGDLRSWADDAELVFLAAGAEKIAASNTVAKTASKPQAKTASKTGRGAASAAIKATLKK